MPSPTAPSNSRVRIPTPLRAFTAGQDQLECSGASVREALNDLVRRHPGLAGRILDEAGELRRFVNVFVGNQNIRALGGIDATLPHDAELSIVPAVAGGAR